MNPNFRREPIRSDKIRNSAKGEACTLRFVGVCCADPEKTVLCHVHDAGFGMGRKADDSSSVYGCDRCHAFLDHGWVGKISRTVLLEHIIRGMQETWRRQIERELIVYPITIERPSQTKSGKPKRPSRPIATRPFNKSLSRKMDGTVVRRRADMEG
jgi:hypothetical protein